MRIQDRRLDRRTGEGKGGRKMWKGIYRVIDLRRGCAERSAKGVFTSNTARSLCDQIREVEGD